MSDLVKYLRAHMAPDRPCKRTEQDIACGQAAAELESLRSRLAEAEGREQMLLNRCDVLEEERNDSDNRLAEAERDAERLDWIEANLIEGKWDGTIGRPKSWHMVGPYRHTLQSMRGNTLREAIDAHLSRKEQP